MTEALRFSLIILPEVHNLREDSFCRAAAFVEVIAA
jgi:hypothetical protein